MLAAMEGPEELLEIRDAPARVTAFIVIDSTRLGPAFGGIRLRAYPQERDALLDAMDLARAMTVKASLAGLHCGGGKIVLMDRPGLHRDRALALIAKALNDLGGRFHAGPDYGFTPTDLAWVRRRSRFAAAEPKGSSCLAEATARGTMAAVRAALAFAEGGRDTASRAGPRRRPARGAAAPDRPRGSRARFARPRAAAGASRSASGAAATGEAASGEGTRLLSGARVSVEGAGAVGASIVRRLIEEGSRVTASDVDDGAARRAAALGAKVVSPDRLAALAADVFIPAATGGTLDERFAARCRARIVCGPANNQLASPEIEERLRRQGTIFVPDTIVGAGALITGVMLALEGKTDAGPAIDRIGRRVGQILMRSSRTGRLATEVALDRALIRLRRGF